MLLCIGLAVTGMNIVADSGSSEQKEGFVAGVNELVAWSNDKVGPVFNSISDKFNTIWNSLPAMTQSEDSSADSESDKRNFISRKWNNLSATQKYAFGIVTLSAVAAGVAYQLGYFSKTSDLNVTEQDIQEMIESVISNDLIAPSEKLSQVFEVLVRNGLGNIVVYSDTMFDVEDTFRVEINGDKVFVTRCK